MAREDQTNKNKGQGWHGDPEGHAKAGREGGKATAQSHDREFYQQIGHEGGVESSGSFEPGSERAKEAGRKGGKATGGNNQNRQDDN